MRNDAASQHGSSLDCLCVTSCSLDISSNTGRHQQTDSSRNGTSSAGERRKGRVTGACTAWRSTPGWRQTPSAESLSGQGWTERWLLITCSVTPRQTRGIIFITRAVLLFFLEPLKHSQPVWYYGLMMKHGSNQWVWGASKMALEKQHHLTVAPVWCQSAVDRLISGTWW